MKEATAYKSEFIVATCPECDATTYIDIADDINEGYIPENGRKITCWNCQTVFLLMDY